MFTGIIEDIGRVRRLEPKTEGARLRLQCPFASAVEIGESVAVNGACLTVAEIDSERSELAFDLLGETLQRTNLSDLEENSIVNLERSLRLGDRLSGHFVQGHIDCCGTVSSYIEKGEDHELCIAFPQEYRKYLAPKGSICINGISLTVARLQETECTICIIPHTHQITNLHQITSDSLVNLEFDLLAKHIEQLLANQGEH